MKPRAAAVLLSFAVFCQPFGLAQQASPPADRRLVMADSRHVSDQVPDSPGVVQARLARVLNPAESASPQAGSLSNTPGGTSATEPTASNPEPVVEGSSRQAIPVAPAKPQTDVPDMPPVAGEQIGAESNQSNVGPVTGPAIIHEPVGTALAEPLQTTGVAASRPAGAAVAPAEQHRVRTILIRVGSLVGAGVAIGTTMALSQGSPSKPPGSH